MIPPPPPILCRLLILSSRPLLSPTRCRRSRNWSPEPTSVPSISPSTRPPSSSLPPPPCRAGRGLWSAMTWREATRMTGSCREGPTPMRLRYGIGIWSMFLFTSRIIWWLCRRRAGLILLIGTALRCDWLIGWLIACCVLFWGKVHFDQSHKVYFHSISDAFFVVSIKACFMMCGPSCVGVHFAVIGFLIKGNDINCPLYKEKKY